MFRVSCGLTAQLKQQSQSTDLHRAILNKVSTAMFPTALVNMKSQHIRLFMGLNKKSKNNAAAQAEQI